MKSHVKDAKGLDWPALMRAGLQGLRLRPAEFWALTPGELQLMLGASGNDAPLLSDGLAALMAAYPDKEKGTRDGRF
ncbi:MAG: rcc01693 family protein [Sulfitobacter sp.]